MNIQFNIILIIIGISLGCGKKSDEKSSPPPTSSNTPSSPDSQTTENNGVTDPSYIKSPKYKNIDFFACKATDSEYICHENATILCKYYNFRFAEDYGTRLGYINPGVKLTFFRSDGSPYIDEFRGLEDSLAISFDYVKCN